MVNRMRVILSRKGFDSSNGGITSPIFEDGSMVSFPIPSDDKDTYDDLVNKGKSYSCVLGDLGYKGGKHCHVDPDLDQGRRKKTIDGWIPAFGQHSASASYLMKNDVREGDIFLFFGNFHHVKECDGKYRRVCRTGDFYKDKDLQVIWGYLQVGKVLKRPDEQRKLWWHPHSSEARVNSDANVIFTAADTLSFDSSKPGAGLLAFDEKRVLTLLGANKATWKKNTVYDVDHICGNRKNSAKDLGKGIYYAGIWQELVLKESAECEEWAKQIIL